MVVRLCACLCECVCLMTGAMSTKRIVCRGAASAVDDDSIGAGAAGAGDGSGTGCAAAGTIIGCVVVCWS